MESLADGGGIVRVTVVGYERVVIRSVGHDRVTELGKVFW
jgi:hypothetical protein